MQERRVRLADVRGPSVADNPSDARLRPFSLDIADLEDALKALGANVEPERAYAVATGSNCATDRAVCDEEANSTMETLQYLKRIDKDSVVLSHTGIGYLDFFSVLNEQLMPHTYFEIGTESGQSMLRFKCDAVCVDPNFQINQNVLNGRRLTFFFQMRSQEFFAHYDVRAFFPNGIDVVFQDGLHHFEMLLLDFINTEKICNSKSLMILHDCLPLNQRMAERDHRLDETEDPLTRGHWTGDVWLLLPILKRYRPDLRILLVDCPPTGLVLCSNLDPQSTILAENYERIIEEFSRLSLSQFGLANAWQTFPMLDSAKIAQQPDCLPALLGLSDAPGAEAAAVLGSEVLGDNPPPLPQRAHGDGGEVGGASTTPPDRISHTLDFPLAPQNDPALQFINPEGKVGAAIVVRHEPLSGQGSFQYRIYDQEDGRWYEPFRVNGDEHPPEHPNSRFNRHARFLYGFYTPGVAERERASMEFHCDPDQVTFQITSHKTNRPLMVLNQVDAPEDDFPIVLVHNPNGPVFALRRNGDLSLKGAIQAGRAVTIEAAVTQPKHAATKAYVDDALAPLRAEITRLRDEVTNLRAALRAGAGAEADLQE